MNPLQVFPCFGLILLLASSLVAGQRPLAIDDIESWNRITETVISPDGRWIAYTTQPDRGDSTVHLVSSKGEKQFECVCGRRLRMTRDSRFLVFTIAPRYADLRKRKLRKPRQADVLTEELGIYAIDSRRLERVPRIKTYKLPQHWAGWLAYQTAASADKSDKSNPPGRQPKAESSTGGSALNLRNLRTGQTRSWPFVTDYRFAAKGERLFFVSTGDDANFEAGIYVYDLLSEQLTPIMTGRHDYRQLAVSDKGTRLAFLLGSAGEFRLYLWTGAGRASQVASNHSPGLPPNWRISEHGRPFFSRGGGRLFFGTAPARPRRDPSIPDDEYPTVDVWHGGEPVLHPQQLNSRDRDLRKAYLAMVPLGGGAVVQIETEDMPHSRLLGQGDADNVLLHSTKPYDFEAMWDRLRYDAYLLNLATGGRRLVAKGVRDHLRPSPAGKYLAWFDYSDYSYYTYHVASGKTYRVSRPELVRADCETNTTFDYNAAYGVAGWLGDDRALLVYDRYDVWRLDPENRTSPKNLTLSGRKSRIAYRLLQLGRGRDVLDEAQMQYLLGVNEVTRASGYYRCTLDGRSEPELLVGGPYRLSHPLKADHADTVVYTRETFNVFPDLLVSDLRFRDTVRISNANPQQADFLWGTAELYRWTSLDGQPLEGLLYKPENFDPSRRYPMIVQFFHKSSDQLFDHRTPEFHRSRIDYHYFVSNGYIVFNPDIYFTPGYIGESAYKSIMPGVTALVDAGFVDRRRIGMQGHSYSGYPAGYMATRPPLFACIEAGAPIVDFVSGYGAIRWETGGSRAAQYERDQTLGSLWEVPLRFMENSPVFALDKVTTPILILHNEGDGAVLWAQGIELFIGLRRLRSPVWLLNYHGEGHHVLQFRNRKDFQIRLSQFFAHYLKDAPMPEWMRTGIPAVDKDHNLGYELTP